MSYDFSFNNKTFSFLLGGLAFVGIMLFVAGLLVGASLKEETPTPVAALWQQDALRARISLQPLSPQPALVAEAARPAAAPAVAATPGEAPAPGEVAAPPSITAAPTRQAHSNPIAVSSSSSDDDESSSAPIPQANGEDIRVIQRADASAPVAEDLNKAGVPSYSVQVGVFLDEKNADLLVRDMRDRGYTPIVLKATDDQSRVWHAVRIGAYVSKTAAMQAAAGISRQEKIKVIVRPLGSL
ncbi:MAG TPA: SPOR domain-containing protein [Pyrinomonadaceae bacterium]|jgi:cell division septation protein DedD